MKIVSFNVNGIRSMLKKNGFNTLIQTIQPDILCFQEIKTQQHSDLDCFIPTYRHIYTNVSQHKKGYSGVAFMTNIDPEWVEYGFERFEEDIIGTYKQYDFTHEGRIITVAFKTCIVITVYTPNAKHGLVRIEERMVWENVLRNYMKQLEIHYHLPVILCGDLNCAHEEIDVCQPKGKKNTPGFSTQERQELHKMIQSGFTDSFRYIHPERVEYTYWSNFAQSRERNIGWRLDMILVSDSIQHHIKDASCLVEYHGSDHCPVYLDIDI